MEKLTRLDIPSRNTSSISDPSGNESSPYAYVGLSWFSTTDLGTQVVWHNGGIDGYSSFVGFNPAKQIGLVYM